MSRPSSVIFPFSQASVLFAVEEDNGALGWLCAQCRRLALDLFQRAELFVARVGDRERAVLDRTIELATGEANGVVLTRALGFHFGFVLRPAIAGEAAGIEDGAEFSITQGDDLNSEFLTSPAAVDLAGIFALKGKIGVGLGLCLS